MERCLESVQGGLSRHKTERLEAIRFVYLFLPGESTDSTASKT